MKRVLWNQGDQVTETDLTEIGTDVEYSFCQDLFRQLFDAGEYHGGATPAATGDAPDDAATVRDASDLNMTAVPTYGFFGDGFRVVVEGAVPSAAVRVKAGWGLIWAAAVGPGFSLCFRVRLAADHLGFNAIAPATVAGRFRRDIVCVYCHIKNTTATVLNMDSSGTVTATSAVNRAEPEVIDGGATTLVLVTGVEAVGAANAARPAIPANYALLAEIMVDSTGIANAANIDGLTSGIKDFRPRLFPRKAAGFSSPRRATCSMDEGTLVANYPDAKRWGAKAVGEEIVFGVADITAVHPAAVAQVVLDTSRDWRDMEIDVEWTAFTVAGSIPGSAAWSFTSYPAGGGNSGFGKVRWYSGDGSDVGAAGHTSPASATAADAANSTLTFFVSDGTTYPAGALCVTGKSGAALTTYFGFRAVGRGPLGLHVTVAGLES